MLKVDPKRRITVSGLVTHPWLMKGVEVPVEWHSKYKVHFINGLVATNSVFKSSDIARLKPVSPATETS